MSILCIAIARGLDEKTLFAAFNAVIKGGIKNLEITMNTDNAPELIKKADNEFKKEVQIGAGTVVTMNELDKALDAGAKFIVSPVVNIEMIQYCRDNKIPVFPGALTPTEIYSAWEAGATMVKVFPVSTLGGPDYIKNLKGPLNSVKLLATGGVRPENVLEYIEKGADGIGLGGQLFNKEWISAGEYYKITTAAESFLKVL